MPEITEQIHWKINEATKALDISRATIYSLMGTGKLPWVKIGRSRRVRPQDVYKLINGNTTGGWSIALAISSHPQ